jgi:DNA-binding NtrC family response regulator
MLAWVRCLIVDDNQPFLEEARQLLEREGIDVIGVATTASARRAGSSPASARMAG